MKYLFNRSFWIWLTAISVLLSALMPAFSHSARLQTADGSLAPVCTSSGMKWLDTTSGELREQSATDDTTLTAEHCAWCTVHPVTLSSSRQDVAPLFLSLAEAAPPVFAPHSHPFSWPPSQPRAPPVAA